MSDAVKLNDEEENLELLEGFTLLDDEFMTIVFDRNTEATELLLNIILGRNDMEVTEVVAQREYKNPVTGGRSIKLDIYAKGSDGKVYDIEVQNENAGADVHRARFHSSMLDTKMLKEKQKFKEIHESYVIFICTSAVDMFYQELAKSVRHFKETEGGRSQMSKAMEERINRERIDNSFEHIKNLMEAMKMTAEQAMSILKIPDEDRAVLSKRF